MQSDQCLCCSLPRYYNTYTCKIQNSKTLASLCSWAGQFESYLVASSWRQVFSWCGSYVFQCLTFSWPIKIQKTGRKPCQQEYQRERAMLSMTCQTLDTKIKPPHDKTNKMACAPSKDSDQPGHTPSLIRVFAVRMKKAWVLSYPLRAQQRLFRLGGCPGWSESWLGTQSFCWFCHEGAQIGVWLEVPLKMRVYQDKMQNRVVRSGAILIHICFIFTPKA